MMEIESRIRDRAYAIWEAQGRPEGCAVDHWLAAEAKTRTTRVRRAASSTDGAAAKRPARKTKTTAAADSR